MIRALFFAWVLAFADGIALPAQALDKQGSAHDGAVAGSDHGLAIAGSVLAGSALYNPTYGARPDNSGRALARLAPHLDVDLIGSRLSIPIDLNLFSDRLRSGLGKLAPSEFDVISGVTSTWPIGASALELGARYERDMPVDRDGLNQSYVNVRARFLFSLAAFAPRATDWLQGGDVSGYAALGWFSYNPSYAARPNNSGRALLRYVAHVGLSAFDHHLLASLDGTMFTDRRENAIGPSELDATIDVGGRLESFELHLAYERDMPVDQQSLVQHFVFLYVSVGFDLFAQAEPAATPRAGSRLDPDGCE